MKRLYYGFIIVLAVAMIACIFGGHAYVLTVLKDYENAQPEKCVEQVISEMGQPELSEHLESVVLFPELNQASYDKDISGFDEYRNMFKSKEGFSYKVQTGNFSENGQTYQLLLNNNPVAIIELESVSEVQKLAILKLMEWKVKEIRPIVTISKYDYKVNVPSDSSVYINGHLMENPVLLEDGSLSYELATLYNEPEIKICDRYNVEAQYDIINNIVSPILHKYELRLPKSYTVYVGDTMVEGALNGDNIDYAVSTASECLTIKDTHGNEVTYTGSQEIYAYSNSVSIPSNYTLEVNGKVATDYFVGDVDNSKYIYCSEYVDMPKQKLYELNDFMVKPEIRILDNNGEEVKFSAHNGVIEITEQMGTPEIPDVFIEDGFDPLKLAKTWSLFMTDDIGGDDNGFSTIKKYLIKDSYMYKVAYKWSTGIDITLTSAHHASDNYFEDEYITNFVKYSDNVYSFNAHFTKYMYLYKSGIWVDDEMNSTFYVMKDESGRWVILDIQEIIAVG